MSTRKDIMFKEWIDMTTMIQESDVWSGVMTVGGAIVLFTISGFPLVISLILLALLVAALVRNHYDPPR